MGHTPFGYKIENGIAVIDQPAADKLRQLYKNYLSGMSLSKAASAAFLSLIFISSGICCLYL